MCLVLNCSRLFWLIFCRLELSLLASVLELLHELDVKLVARDPPLAVVLQLAREHGEASLVSFAFRCGVCIASQAMET